MRVSQPSQPQSAREPTLHDVDEHEVRGRRDHQKQKVPYLITVGDKEVESNQLAVRTRDNKVEMFSQEKIIDHVLNKIKTRAAED